MTEPAAGAPTLPDGPLLTCPWCRADQRGRIANAQISHLIECGDKYRAEHRAGAPMGAPTGGEALRVDPREACTRCGCASPLYREWCRCGCRVHFEITGATVRGSVNNSCAKGRDDRERTAPSATIPGAPRA